MDEEQGGERGYLCVDGFIVDLVGARALASALELGLIDHLLVRRTCSLREFGEHAGLDEPATRLLAGMLRANGVLEGVGESAQGGAGGLRLGDRFIAALAYRDLLEAKLDFAASVAPDFLGLFTTLLVDPGRFFAQAKLFELFSYDRCFESTPENLASTARWMRFTTALTRYESAACIARHDFSAHARMLDVGGNSGEFALRVCRRNPKLRATVFDLPLVCEIGADYLRTQLEVDRIDFIKADRAGGALPQGYDLITFKSMLHDWPDEPMHDFLARAHAALTAGGTVLIYERGRLEIGDNPLPYAQIPIMLFFRAYRPGNSYVEALARAGFRDIRLSTVLLDLPFLLLTAKK